MKNAKHFIRIFVANSINYVIMNWKFLNQPLGMSNLSGGFAPKEKHIAWVIPAIMAATSIASSVYGGVQSSKANKKAQQQVDAERAANQAERRRRMNEDYIDTAAGQNLIRMARDEANKIWKREQGAAAVNGSTESAKQMAKDAGNQMMGNAIANIAANDTTRKDSIDASYRAQDRALAQQQIGLQQQAAAIKAQAASQISSSLMNAAGQYLGASMGAGSPGGGGVTATGNTGSALNNMAQTPTNEMLMANAMQQATGYNSSYNTVMKYLTPDLWRQLHPFGN